MLTRDWNNSPNQSAGEVHITLMTMATMVDDDALDTEIVFARVRLTSLEISSKIFGFKGRST